MDKPRKKPAGGGSPRFRASNRAADGSYPVPPAKHDQEIPDIFDVLADMTPEELVKAASPQAIRTILSIMQKPGRNAAAQLAAARMIMDFGVSKPIVKQDIHVTEELSVAETLRLRRAERLGKLKA